MSNVLVISNEPIHNRRVYSCKGKHKIFIEFVNDTNSGFSLVKSLRPDIIFIDWMVGNSPALLFKEKCIRLGFNAKFIYLVSAGDIPLLDAEDVALQNSEYMYLPVNLYDIVNRIICETDIEVTEDTKEYTQIVKFSDLEIDYSERQVYLRGTNCMLAQQEFCLLDYLVKNRERACSRKELVNILFGEDAIIDERAIDIYINRLRKKIEVGRTSAFHNKYIFTIRGKGYKFLNVE